MSKNSDENLDTIDKILKGLVYLIEGLEELGLIDVSKLHENIRMSVVKIKFDKRVNYKEVAKWLSEGYPVFIPIDRRRAYYAGNRLSELLNIKVNRKPAMWENEKGYFFFI